MELVFGVGYLGGLQATEHDSRLQIEEDGSLDFNDHLLLSYGQVEIRVLNQVQIKFSFKPTVISHDQCRECSAGLSTAQTFTSN